MEKMGLRRGLEGAPKEEGGGIGVELVGAEHGAERRTWGRVAFDRIGQSAVPRFA